VTHDRETAQIAAKIRVVPEISTARKLGILGRVAARQAGENRIVRAGFGAIKTTVAHSAKVLHLLFLQVAGVFFVAFAAGGGIAAWREYHKWQAGQIGPGKVYLAAGFSALFLWFAVSSFWRAGRKN
jgi:hypothetical protein